MPNWTTVLLAALLLAGADAGAHAQTYPSTTVKLIVPVPAGGVTDTMARIVAPATDRGVGAAGRRR